MIAKATGMKWAMMIEPLMTGIEYPMDFVTFIKEEEKRIPRPRDKLDAIVWREKVFAIQTIIEILEPFETTLIPEHFFSIFCHIENDRCELIIKQIEMLKEQYLDARC